MATIYTTFKTSGDTISTLISTQTISVSGGAGGGIDNVVEDTTPQLGGNLDLNSNDITGTGNITHTGTITTTGNIVVSGTVDGRDVASDGTKLDGIEAGATADQTDGEIETAYNNQVAQVSAGEKTAGTETSVRRFSPKDVADMAGTHGGGGGGGLDNVVEDTTPQLGGDLDLNGNDINGQGNIILTDGTNTVIELDQTNNEIELTTDPGTGNEKIKIGHDLSGLGGDVANGHQAVAFSRTNDGTYVNWLGVVNDSGSGSSDLGLNARSNFRFYSNNSEIASISPTGNLAVSGTVDGRDVATDGTKLDGIESGATADQTGAEIKVAYEAEADTNAFTDAEKTKLTGIETGAEVNTVDSVNTQTGAVVLDADDISDAATTNKFTTAGDISKLAGIESGATADQSDAEIETAYNNQVSQVSAGEITAGTETAIRRYSPADVKNFVDTHGGGGGGGISNVVEDTTPQLGGNLDLNSNNITGTGSITHTGNLTTTGNIAVTGTVDGRDVATDGTKLDGIESGATADQTGAEIKVAYEAEADTNAFTDAEKTKLTGIETGAEVNTVDSVNTQTGAVVLDADDISDAATTNKFTTAAEISKLAGIETAATADQTDAEIETAYNNQVGQVSAGEKTAGTETLVRRFSPKDVADMASTFGGGGLSWFIGTCTDTSTMTASTWTPITWNTEIKKDTGFTHTTDSEDLTLSNGIYIFFVMYLVDSPGRVDVYCKMSLDTGSGFTDHKSGVLGSFIDTAPPFGSLDGVQVIPYSATSGDIVRFELYTESSTVDLSTSEIIAIKVT